MHTVHGNFFYTLSNKKRLAKYLRVSLKELLTLQDDSNYKVWFEEGENGKLREIQEPSYKLKSVHSIIQKSLASIVAPEFLFSGVKGKSNISNASYHKDSNYIVTADIRSFYINCNKEYIFRFFKYTLHTSDDIARILTELCCYKTFLPTGSPVSQILAYHSYARIFNRIDAFSKANYITFSLYVDDITLSSEKSIHPYILKKISKLLESVNLSLKREKTKFYNKNSYKIVTGCAISPDHILLRPNKIMRKINNKLRKHEKDLSKLTSKEIESVLGQVIYLRSITPNSYSQLFKSLSLMKAEERFKQRPL